MNFIAHPPKSLYRVQLHEQFNFEKLKEILSYLSALGISHVYASPIFMAYPGSTHGYDVNDLNRVNPELGGMEKLVELSLDLKKYQLGLIQDFVPNHMGVLGPNNWRWIDVLENGRSSLYAPYFDIQWNSRESILKDRVLVPILHDFYGRVLESGDIHIAYQNGAFGIDYRGQKFPLCAQSYSRILERLSWLYEPGSEICEHLENLSRQFKLHVLNTKTHDEETYQKYVFHRDELRREFAKLVTEKKLQSGLDRVFKNINGTANQPASFDALHEILEEQHYRLAYWKVASYEINYRRFFAIDTLVGLKMERPEVFTDCHQLLYHLLKNKLISGVRLDHIDGLWDPTQYLHQLLALFDEEKDSPYVLVEKILTPGENLPTNWPIQGTTGYEFAGDVINVLIHNEAEPEFTKIYEKFTGIKQHPDELMYQLKQYIIEELFPNAFDNLATSLAAQIKMDRYWRDFAVNELRDAIKNIVSCLAVYRTYRREGHAVDEQDLHFIHQAIDLALAYNPLQDGTPYEFIRSLWSGKYPEATSVPEDQIWAAQWVSSLQQITGAVMAKSVEDTFFYRYVRLLAANEVGHDPREFGRDLASFHETNSKRQKIWPHNLLASSTHDTKLSEDVRARLLVLSEIPEEWAFRIQEWQHLNQKHKTQIDEHWAPDANEEYLLYQILLGAKPLEKNWNSEDFRQRIQNYFQKAISEAKVNTTWNRPSEAWEKAGTKFIESILDSTRSAEFLISLESFSEKIAQRGMINALAQVALKLTCPGVPDVYQGNEIWDFSLVDPDNRRPVDYTHRQKLLRSLPEANPQDLLAQWQDGRIKLLLTQKLLSLRQTESELFAQGDYVAHVAIGTFAKHVIAYSRQREDRQLLVVIPRWSDKIGHPPLGDLWQDTALTLPPDSGPWRNEITGEKISASNEHLPLSVILNSFPIALLSKVRS